MLSEQLNTFPCPVFGFPLVINGVTNSDSAQKMIEKTRAYYIVFSILNSEEPEN
jgi:hypothetical protein